MTPPALLRHSSTVQPPRIIRSDELRRENRGRLIHALRRLGPSSRTALGDATGLSAAAISSFAAELVPDGVLNTTRAAGSRGRPQSTLELAADAASAIGITLTIDRLTLELIDYAGTVRASQLLDLDTRALSADALVRTILGELQTMIDHPEASSLCQVSVAFQGITAPAGGTLLWSPILGVGDVALGDAITARYGLPVSVQNDCRLIARALHAGHRERLGAHFATVLFSHGVGLALTLHDEPFAGISSSALELGHLTYRAGGAPCRCGQQGCIEAYAADYAILRALGEVDGAAPSGRLPDDALGIATGAAARGDKAARAAFDAAGSAIGSGLRDLFLLLGPMPVALVGRDEAVLDAMRPALVEALEAAGPQAGALAHVALEAFPDDTALLARGLAQESLAAIDRQMSIGKRPDLQSTDAPLERARS